VEILACACGTGPVHQPPDFPATRTTAWQGFSGIEVLCIRVLATRRPVNTAYRTTLIACRRYLLDVFDHKFAFLVDDGYLTLLRLAHAVKGEF